MPTQARASMFVVPSLRIQQRPRARSLQNRKSRNNLSAGPLLQSRHEDRGRRGSSNGVDANDAGRPSTPRGQPKVASAIDAVCPARRWLPYDADVSSSGSSSAPHADDSWDGIPASRVAEARWRCHASASSKQSPCHGADRLAI